MIDLEFVGAVLAGNTTKTYLEFKKNKTKFTTAVKDWLVTSILTLLVSHFTVTAILAYSPSLEKIKLAIWVLSGALILNIFKALVGLDFSLVLASILEKLALRK